MGKNLIFFKISFLDWDTRMVRLRITAIQSVLSMTLNFAVHRIRIHLSANFENYFGRIEYIVYKKILYKDTEYYDTYDLGKLNTFANSGGVIKSLFTHKFRWMIYCLTDTLTFVYWCY